MKALQMKYYHALRKTNPLLAKNKAGRSLIMKEAVLMARWEYNYKTTVDAAMHQ